MSNYVKATNFYAKDALLTGDPSKIIKGSEIDDEYNAIATAMGTKADLNSPIFTGVPTAPTAASGTNTTQVATTAFVITNGVPAGGILLWSGSILSVPLGFQLCDGTNGTPDLRNRFVVGAGSTYAVNATGGSADSVVVSHSHTADYNDSYLSNVGYSTSINAGTRTNPITIEDSGEWSEYVETGRNDGGNRWIRFLNSLIGRDTTTSTVGVSGTNANLPPYFALAYIMKL